ncbi:pentapeptide repeat-containing protein [Anabaenopsis elenkinii]|uniref:Pentapeptide repeat-containing protein n=1 Tax=Anabaenopsis elenkinii CCIBt3563 TaxID=2779889 RepID=A0A7U3NLP5_9CYAN|nr:pentapeptide repeat-containing protein [Anabaenopsis elenkinii]QOV21176.1 pentapeptide repeat-containing protein [Anabaenopsis elenkinii CCIBt3563]
MAETNSQENNINTTLTLLERYAAGKRDFTGVNLGKADLQGVDLKGCDFSYADLSEANLNGANLRGCDLSFANLAQADLQNADLRGALLFAADLRQANLRGTKLEKADCDRNTLFPDHFDLVSVGLRIQE